MDIDVNYVANLARIHLTEEETSLFQGQMEQIVEYVKKIGELDLSGVEAASHTYPVFNVYRADEVKPGLDRESVLKNAPASNEEQFVVPKIVE